MAAASEGNEKIVRSILNSISSSAVLFPTSSASTINSIDFDMSIDTSVSDSPRTSELEFTAKLCNLQDQVQYLSM